MNNLEFIDREIELCKHEIQINKISIENQFDKTFYKNRAEVMNEKLQTLQQIKSELEAWEVVKKKLTKETLDKAIDFIDVLCEEYGHDDILETKNTLEELLKYLYE